MHCGFRDMYGSVLFYMCAIFIVIIIDKKKS